MNATILASWTPQVPGSYSDVRTPRASSGSFAFLLAASRRRFDQTTRTYGAPGTFGRQTQARLTVGRAANLARPDMPTTRWFEMGGPAADAPGGMQMRLELRLRISLPVRFEVAARQSRVRCDSASHGWLHARSTTLPTGTCCRSQVQGSGGTPRCPGLRRSAMGRPRLRANSGHHVGRPFPM